MAAEEKKNPTGLAEVSHYKRRWCLRLLSTVGFTTSFTFDLKRLESFTCRSCLPLINLGLSCSDAVSFLSIDVTSCFLSRPRAMRWVDSCRALQLMTAFAWMKKAASQRERTRKWRRKRRRWGRRGRSTFLQTCLAEYPVGRNSDTSFIITHTHAGFKSKLDPFHTCTHLFLCLFIPPLHFT